MGFYRQIVLDDDGTNEALEVAGREARVRVPGYGGGPAKPGVAMVRPVAAGYGGFGKHRAKGRVRVPGYGTAPVTVQVLRFPTS